MKNLLSDDKPAAAPGHAGVQNFVYRDWNGEGPPPEIEAGSEDMDDAAAGDFLSHQEAQALIEHARTEAWQQARAAAWEQAKELAEQEIRAPLERQLNAERAALAEALRQFEQQRKEYFHQLERELVQMVLAITRKILNREAQIDPLLLAGTVRVALDPLAAGTPVELAVAPSTLPSWEEMLAREHPLASPPTLRADPALEPSGCRITTDTGVTELSWEIQLREIEQGFLDLLQRRTAIWASEDPQA